MFHQVIEETALRLTSDEFSQIGQRRDDLRHLMYKTIGALDVLLLYLHTIDTGIACLAAACVVLKKIIVIVSDLAIVQEGFNEMHHGHC